MSHLIFSPETPLLVRAAGAAVLGLHISAGLTGIGSGAAALALRKGGRGHRVAGTVFFVSMLTMSGIGAVVSPMLQDPISSGMGVFTFYLVASGWLTVVRKPGQVGRAEIAILLLGLGAAGALATLGGLGAVRPNGTIGGQPYAIGLVFAGVVAFAVALDLRMILGRGVTGASRVARHLWRLCLALGIATGSFFLGQPQVFPAPLRGSPLLIGLAVAPLILLIFWMFRVRLAKRSGLRLAPA